MLLFFSMEKKRVVIIGGGAAGFFGAIACAEANPALSVMLLEKTRQLLSKVRISGGGRCNVTHSCFQPGLLVQNYPRGEKALRGPFSAFQPKDTIDWFAARGVLLKTESDGRMFPITDSSETIIQCLIEAAKRAGVVIETEKEVLSIQKGEDGSFRLQLSKGELFADALLIATGSNAKAYKWIEQLGHTIAPPVPSLFTFNIVDPRLGGLSGISVPKAEVSIVGTKLKEVGPLLITHWGVSGPAVLKLSAWGARELHARGYVATLLVNWLPDAKRGELQTKLQQMKKSSPKKAVALESCFALPKNLWKRLVLAAGIEESRLFAHLSNKEIEALLDQLCKGSFAIDGKSTYKEEFVTCGGVALDEVNFQTMESRLCRGLYFSGEVLDIDGITGGFNFQNAWTTGWLAGRAIANED